MEGFYLHMDAHPRTDRKVRREKNVLLHIRRKKGHYHAKKLGKTTLILLFNRIQNILIKPTFIQTRCKTFFKLIDIENYAMFY